MQIEWWPIDRPKAYEKNARKIPQKAIDKVALSLRTFGWQQPISVDVKDVIVAGHTRLLAAQQEKHTKVPVVIASNLTPAQIRAYRIMDNRSHQETEWDDDILGLELGELKGLDLDLGLTGFDPRELDKLFGIEKAAPEAEMDRAEELLAKWKVERGQIWQIGRHRLMCGDCTNREDLMGLMGGEKADMLFTDPPYGVNYEGGRNPDSNVPRTKLEGDESGALYAMALDAAREHFKPSAPWYVWFAGTVGAAAYSAVESCGYKVRAMIIWNKVDAHYGNFMAQYMQKHEPCLYCIRASPVWKGPTNEVTVWDVKQPSRNEYHSTQKPVELATRAIGNSSDKDGIVVDLFLGSRTTMVASEQLGRACYGLEIEPKYCAVILERMAAMGVVGELANVTA